MRSLWSQWPRLRESFAGKNAVLFLDFDGTLAPIVADPSQARIPAATREALAQLACSPRVVVGIVSGRQLAELRRLVGLRNICYVGSHGLEWVLSGGRPHLRATPAQRRRIRQIADGLGRALRGLPGVWIERKPASVAVHYRNASQQHARKAVAEAERATRHHASELRLLRGKKIVELLPGGATSKGTTVEALLARLSRGRRSCLVAYFGDDATDESVFVRLRKNGLGVFVGKPRRTTARFYLRSPREVCEFLQQLCTIVS